MMSTRTPRRAARFSAVMSAWSGKKYGVRICTEVCAQASAASNVQRSFVKSASGPSVMTARDDVPAFLQFGKPRIAREDFAGGEGPIVGEGLLQLRHHRAFERNCRSCTGRRGLSASTLPWRMFMPPVKAIRPSTTSILRWLRRLIVVTRHGASAAESGRTARARVSVCARWTARNNARPRRQSARAPATPRATARPSASTNCLPAAVVVENVSRQGNGCGRRLDRREHRGKRLVAVDQWLNLVARNQWLRRHTVHDARQHPQVFRFEALRFAHVFGYRLRNGIARAAAHPQRLGMAADAIDAKHNVEHRPAQRAATR